MRRTQTIFLALLPLLGACSDSSGSNNTQASAINFASQVYVISEESDELFVIDVSTNPPSAAANINTALEPGEINANHMAVVSETGEKIYVIATYHDAVAVVDRAKMEVVSSIPIGHHPTHATLRQDFGELWVVNEDSNSVSVIDTATDSVTHTIEHSSIFLPHQVQWDLTNTLAFVPNIGANQITIIDAMTYTVTGTLVPEGLTEGMCSGDPCGFADAQVDPNGILYAAHIESGKVVVFDTVTMTRGADQQAGSRPWMAYVDQFDGASTFHYLIPNFGDSTLSRVNAQTNQIVDNLAEGDTETYGINYSPLAPGLAFVMNRNREEITVIDVETSEVVKRIDTGGNIETACTTDDGRYIVAPISSTGEVTVIDVLSLEEVARFQNVGVYPWSSATLGGQNYCH